MRLSRFSGFALVAAGLSGGFAACVSDEGNTLIRVVEREAGTTPLVDTGAPVQPDSTVAEPPDGGAFSDGGSVDAAVDAPRVAPAPDGSVLSVLSFPSNVGSPQGSQRVKFDAQGNAFVSFTLNISTSINGTGLSNDAGLEDVAIAKLSPTGAVLWAQTFGGTGREQLLGMAVDDKGDVYVSGSFEVGAGGTSRFGGQLLSNPSQRYGTFVVKLRGTDGTPLAAFNYAQTLQGGSCSTLAFRNGHLAVGCSIEGNAEVPTTDAGFKTLRYDAGGASYNGYVMLLDANDLKAKWVAQLRGASADFVNAVDLAPNGDVFVAGATNSAVMVDDANSLTMNTSGAGQNAFVLRMAAANGFVLWKKNYFPPTAADYIQINGLAANANADTVYVAGSVQGTVTLGAGGVAVMSAGGQDAFIAKLNGTSGESVLARNYGGSGTDSAAAVALDAWDQPYVAGTYRSEGFKIGTVTLPDPVATTASAFFTKLDTALAPLWAKGFTTSVAPTFTQAWSIGVNPKTSGAAQAGVYQGTLNFGDGIPRQSHMTGGGYNAFIVEHAP